MKPFTNTQMTPSAYDALHKLFDLPNPPSAIFVTNNQMTLGTLYAFKDRNLRCPQDISLISFDDHDWAPLFSPAISVVRQPTYRLGQTAAKALMTLINGQQLHPIPKLSVELIIRESCRSLQPEPVN
jgi:LacI family transcriptional regulator